MQIRVLTALSFVSCLQLGNSKGLRTAVKPECDGQLENVLIDFETDGEGKPLTRGSVPRSLPRGITLRASRSKNSKTKATKRDQVIFDTSNAGNDTDLATETENMVLIINKSNDPSNPDDDRFGGKVYFTFNEPVYQLNSLTLLDLEPRRFAHQLNSSITGVDVDGKAFPRREFPPNGNGKPSTLVPTNMFNVHRLVTHLATSGAIAKLDLTFCNEEKGETDELPLTDFRAYDGSDGNKGARAGSVITRKSKANYPGDGSGKTMFEFPAVADPRHVSNLCFKQGNNEIASEEGLTDFVWAFGQFLDHDISITPGDADAGSSPILIREDSDDFEKGTELEFTRGLFQSGTGESGASPRKHINLITSTIDASMVYGSDEERANALRSRKGGQLKTSTDATFTTGHLPPFNTLELENEGNEKFDPKSLFLVGDIRGNEQAALTALHSLFLREHNRLCVLISAQYPNTDDENIYQMARKIVGMEIQKITYEEFLPALLGRSQAPNPESYKYSSKIDMSIHTEFSAAAFRVGHTMISPQLELVSSKGVSKTTDLHDAFFKPELLVAKPWKVDEMLIGLTRNTAQNVDTIFVDEIRQFLFVEEDTTFGTDLAARNIHRSRDMGLANYNDVRRSYGLSANLDFADVTSDLDTQKKLSEAYESPDEMDMFVGALAEDHVSGGAVGELISTVLKDQFTRLMNGDHLFYKGDKDLTDSKLKGIIQSSDITMSNIIRLNTKTRQVPAPNVFKK